MKTKPELTTKKKSRIPRQDSGTRERLLDAAEALLLDQGYAAVTTRRLGEKAGVTPPLLHYYFKSMDELFVCLYRRHAETALQHTKEVLRSGNVLTTLWQMSSDPMDGVLLAEFMALANHRPAVRDEMTLHAEEFRRIQHRAVKKYIQEQGIESPLDPETLIVLMAGIGLLIALESKSGFSFGHNRAKKYMAGLIDSMEAK